MKNTRKILELDPITKKLDEINFNPIAFGIFKFNKRNDLKTTFIPYYRICIVLNGSFNIIRNNLKYNINKSDLFIIASNTKYSAETLEDNSSFYYLDFAFINPDDEDKFIKLIKINDVLRIKNLIEEYQLINLNYLNEVIISNYPGSYMLVKCTLIKLLIAILVYLKDNNNIFIIEHAQNTKEKHLLKIIEYIEQNINYPITIKDIAKHFNYSENYIYRIFKETLNISCKTYINDLKLSKSLDTLKATKLSISEISDMYGFNDIYHFSNSFKKKYGYSPNNYRKDFK